MNKQPISLVLGSSKGLGKEIVSLCEQRGDYVIEASSSVGRPMQTDAGVVFPCDLQSLLSVNKFLEKIRNENIVNFYWVSGITLSRAPFAGHSDREIQNVIDINFRNPMMIAKHVWMQMQGGGLDCSFVVIASSSGIRPRPNEAIYAATKHAQVGFTRSLGEENTNSKVKVSLFLPSGMQTPFWDNDPHEAYDTFLDPKKVAAEVLAVSRNQVTSYEERLIERGSL